MDFSINVLLVDDSNSMRKIMKNILKQAGFLNIFETCNGQDAIEFINNNNVDLIISDWNMPIMNGFELLKYVRENHANKKIPFIMITAESLQKNITEAFDAGATDYILKPFSQEVVISKLKKIFNENIKKNLDFNEKAKTKINFYQYITFNLDDKFIGIDIKDVKEVNTYNDITPVPHSPCYVLGLMNLRGQTVTIFDLSIRLGMSYHGIYSNSYIIILKRDMVGLIVDNIKDIIEVNKNEIENYPANMKGIENEFISGIVKLKDELLIVISANKILEYKR